WDAATGQAWSVFKGHASGVQAVAFDVDGRQLRSVTRDGTIRTWTVPAAERPRGTIISSIRFGWMAISADGTRMADMPRLGAEATRIEILGPSGKPMRSISLPQGAIAATIDTFVLNRNGTRLAIHWNVTDADAETANVYVWDTVTGKEVY